MIENTFKKRKHVLHYDTKDIPTQEQITDILSKAIPLTTSKQKAFAFKAFVLGPDLVRSDKLLTACEGENDEMNRKLGGQNLPSDPNPGLLHLATAPYTLIWTPRLVDPNTYHKKKFMQKKGAWEMNNSSSILKCKQISIEIGMMSKMVMGVALDSGLDSSFCLCYSRILSDWKPFIPQIEFSPILIQTIGKAKSYYWEMLTPEESIDNTNPTIEDLFKFV